MGQSVRARAKFTDSWASHKSDAVMSSPVQAGFLPGRKWISLLATTFRRWFPQALPGFLRNNAGNLRGHEIFMSTSLSTNQINK